MSRTDTRPTWPGTAILNTRICRAARRRSGSRPSDTGKNWWVRTSHTVRIQPRKWYGAGSTVPVTAKTSWTPDLPRWASLMRRARHPGAVCTGFSCWPRPELRGTAPPAGVAGVIIAALPIDCGTSMDPRNAFLTLLALVACGCSISYGATVSGTVKGPEGAALEGVFVRAQNKKTHITVMVLTNSQGHYRMEKLPAGDYELSTEIT